jgi:hypothetical protein
VAINEGLRVDLISNKTGWKFRPRRKQKKSPTSSPAPLPARQRKRAGLRSRTATESDVSTMGDIAIPTYEIPPEPPFDISIDATTPISTPLSAFRDLTNDAGELSLSSPTVEMGRKPFDYEPQQQLHFSVPMAKRFSFEQWLRSSATEPSLLADFENPISGALGTDIPIAPASQVQFMVDRMPVPEVPAVPAPGFSSGMAFTPPPSDYSFPPKQQDPSSLFLSFPPWSMGQESGTSTPGTPMLDLFNVPAWWPFRSVKVRLDDEKGVELQTLLQQLAEEAGQTSAKMVFAMP